MRTTAIIATVCLIAACAEDPTSPPYEPNLPQSWATTISNTYFPLVPGSSWRYVAEVEEGTETIVVEVLNETRVVNGVVATVVRDRVYLDDELIEDTYDWYAQDAAGNVWYLGEDSKEIENGQVISTEGSWEWGRDGALPGIIMWANPAAHIGEAYRQEYYRGEAEDWGKVTAVNVPVNVPFGQFTNCIRTEDWNGLESDSREDKFYCPGIGVTLEVADDERVELVERNGS
jgi:hypothetical protein